LKPELPFKKLCFAVNDTPKRFDLQKSVTIDRRKKSAGKLAITFFTPGSERNALEGDDFYFQVTKGKQKRNAMKKPSLIFLLALLFFLFTLLQVAKPASSGVEGNISGCVKR
jgi:hypothetical protein